MVLTNESYRDLGRRIQILDNLDNPNALTIVNALKLNVARCFRNAKLQHQDFSKLDLTGWDFSGADLRGSCFAHASISGAIFVRAKVDFNDLKEALEWSPKLQKMVQAQVEGKFDPRAEMDESLYEFLQVVTPKQERLELPTGATVLDFAYHIHSDIGDECNGAEVNGIPRPISAELRDGDEVKIIRSQNAFLPTDWRSIAKTRKAHRKIRKRISRETRESGILAGNRIIEKILVDANLNYSRKHISKGLNHLREKSVEDVLEKVGRGHLSTSDFMNAIYPGVSPSIDREFVQIKPTPEDLSTVISGSEPGVSLDMAKCCMPVPGQRIVGIKSDNNSVLVHSIMCSHLSSAEPEDWRWIDLHWRSDPRGVGVEHEIVIDTVNKAGVFSEVLGLIARYDVSVLSIRIGTDHIECLRLFLLIQVTDFRQIENTLSGLRGIASVISAESSAK